MLLLERFEWCGEKLSLREFVEEYSHRLPRIIVILDGYAGRDEQLHQFSSDEVYWVREVARQSRAILSDVQGRYFSVPYSYGEKFQVQRSNGSITGEMDLKEAVVECQSSGDRLLFSQDHRVSFHKGADTGDVERLGLLKLHDVYEQKYILAHSFIGDEVMALPIVIPVYMPLDVDLARGLTYGTALDYTLFNTAIRKFVRKYKNAEIELEEGILMFNELPGNEYDYILPTSTIAPEDPEASGGASGAVGGPPVPPRNKDDDDDDDDEPEPAPWQSRHWEYPKGKKVFFPAPPPPETGDYEEIFDVLQGVSAPGADVPDLPVHRMKVAVMSELRRSVAVDENTLSKICNKAVAVAVRVLSPPPPTAPRQATTRRQPPSLPTTNNHPLPPVPQPTHHRQPAPSPLSPNNKHFPPQASNDKQVPASTAYNQKEPAGGASVKPILVLPPPQTNKPSQAVVPTQRPQNVTGRSLSDSTESRPAKSSEVNRRRSIPPPISRKPVCRHQSEACRLSPGVWTSASEIPEDISGFSVSDVSTCLKLIGLAKHAGVLADQSVDGALLKTLDEEIYINDFGLSRLEARKLDMFVKKNWRPKD